MAKHLLGHLEVGDHAVLEGTDGLDRPRGAAEHPLGLDPHRVDLSGARIHRHHAGLRQDDSPPPDVHERVGGAQIDGHVAAAETGHVAEEAHIRKGSRIEGGQGRTERQVLEAHPHRCLTVRRRV
jgi:hypothetical protein